jgi:hypothetical protein
MNPIIGLYSPAPQSGKTTVAEELVRHGYTRVSFAAPLKRVAITLLQELGYEEQVAAEMVYTNKEADVPEIKASVRHILQTLGTEYGRQCLHPDVWIMCMEKRLASLRQEGKFAVIDDCRFLNEAALIRRLGGELWRVERPSTERGTSHASEGSLDDYPLFDRRLTNDGTLLQLYSQVQSVVTPVAV